LKPLPDIISAKQRNAGYRSSARADGKLQEDMLDMRLHSLGRDFVNPCNALVGEALAYQPENIAFSGCECSADVVAELRGIQVAIRWRPARP